ncbi:MAG: catechol 2,3-dioxygenase [Halobacteriales archaeon]|jgi:catechol 2,3-dioxygenase
MNRTAAGLADETHPGRVAIRVADLDEMVAFYRNVVGLETLQSNGPSATLGTNDEPLIVARQDPDASMQAPDAAGLFHCAFRVPSRAALGDALGRIRDRWALDGASDHRVSEALYCSDPEGNGVEIYRDKPRDAWPVAADGSLRMDTHPLDLDALAGDAGGGTTAPDGTTIGHVHLEVSSLAASKNFYADRIGLDVRQAWGDSALFLAAGNYHHHVGLNTWHGQSESTTGRGLAWFELVVPDAEAVAAVRTRVEAAGLETNSVDDGIEVTDPDGMAVRVRTA